MFEMYFQHSSQKHHCDPHVTISLCYGLATNKRPAITWTNVHIELWRHVTLPGINELNLYLSTHAGPHKDMCMEHMVTWCVWYIKTIARVCCGPHSTGRMSCVFLCVDYVPWNMHTVWLWFVFSCYIIVRCVLMWIIHPYSSGPIH